MKVSSLEHRPGSQRQRGIAAIEMAAILPVMLALMAFTLFFGRYCWHYTVAQRAAHDAALYLSTVPLVEMKSTKRAGAAQLAAHDIAAMETAELNPGPIPIQITAQCNGVDCGGIVVPTTVRVFIQMRFADDIFPFFTSVFTGEDGMVLTADVHMQYVGT